MDVLPVQELSSDVRQSAIHVFPIEPLTFERSWRSRRSRWFFREEDAPYRDIPFWVREASDVEWSILDSEGRPLRRGHLVAPTGVNTLRWDLLLDSDLALEAERQRVGDAADTSMASIPWAETVRLERPLYVTPGTYRVQVSSGAASAEAEFEIKSPKVREPRVNPPPRRRGEQEKKKGRP